MIGRMTMNQSSTFKKMNMLAKTAITLSAAASVHGRLLGQTAVTLISNTVVAP